MKRSDIDPHYCNAARPATDVLLLARNICKTYPGVTALAEMHFELCRGEVHVLFGENGAGKSTLISILAGASQASGGELIFDSEKVNITSVQDARSLGISAVFQEFSLIPTLSVAENIVLGDEPCNGLVLDRQATQKEVENILIELGFDIDPGKLVSELTRAEQQMVEIAKALRSELAVLILDEPTASLTEHETNHLFNLIKKLQARGVGIVYITHRMAEIKRIGNRVTVLRDGRYIATVDAMQTSNEELVRLMTGRQVGSVFPQLDFDSQHEVVLTVEGVSVFGTEIRDVSLNVRGGEIVGLAGLVGSGKSELMRACFGAGRVSAGSVFLNGKSICGRSPGENIRDGFLYLPPDRRNEGLMMMQSIRENMMITNLNSISVDGSMLLSRHKENSAANALANRFHISPANTERAVSHLSGGNQQKVMLARSLTSAYSLLVFDEPTIGVDIATRAAIYEFIADLAREGVAIVLVSSDLPEILHLSHRAYVFYRGQVKAEVSGEQLCEEVVLTHFFDKGVAV